MNKKAL